MFHSNNQHLYGTTEITLFNLLETEQVKMLAHIQGCILHFEFLIPSKTSGAIQAALPLLLVMCV